MRKHIGKHILLGDIGSCRTCGFCGKDKCDNKLKVSRKKGNTFCTIESSDCPFYFDYGKSKVFNKKKESMYKYNNQLC